MRSIIGAAFRAPLVVSLVMGMRACGTGDARGDGPAEAGIGAAPATNPADNRTRPSFREVKGLRGSATAVAFSRDGALIAAGGAYRELMIWDAATGRTFCTLMPPRPLSLPITALCFSPDGKQLAAGMLDGTRAKIITTDKGRIKVPSRVTSWLGVWDIASKREVLHLDGHGGSIRAVGFRGESIITLDSRYVVKSWRRADGSEALTLAANKTDRAGSTTLGYDRFNANATRLLSTCDTEESLGLVNIQGVTLKLWDLTRNRAEELKTGIKSPYFALSADGRRILGFSGGVPMLWNFDTREFIGAFEEKTDQRISYLCYSPDGGRFVTGSDDGRLWLWDAATCRTVEKFQGPEGSIRAVAFLRRGLRIATGGNELEKGRGTVGPVKVWDIEFARRP